MIIKYYYVGERKYHINYNGLFKYVMPSLFLQIF